MAKEFIDKIIQSLIHMLPSLKIYGDPRSVIVFGSAVRPTDFVKGVSDVDVLIITKGRPKRRHYQLEIYETEINISFMSIDEVYNVFRKGYPLAFILYKDSRVIMDDGAFSSLISTLRPKVTEHTLRTLRRSSFVALILGLEKYFYGLYRGAISHAYHAVRHMARYKACLKGINADDFPISDAEVSPHLSTPAREVYELLIDLRRRDVAKDECLDALEAARSVISSEMSCCIPNFHEIERKVEQEGGCVDFVDIKERECSIEIICFIRDPLNVLRFKCTKRC